MARWFMWLIPRCVARIPAWLPVVVVGWMLVACSSRSPGALVSDSGPPNVSLAVRGGSPSLAEPEKTPRGPLLLEAAIEEALRASPELHQIEERIGAAGEHVRQAEAAFYPRVALAEDFNVTNNPVFALMNIINQRRLQPTVDFNNPGRQQNFSSQVRGEWSLFQGGSRWLDRKAALGMKLSVESELQSARNQLVAKVTETYYRWLQSLSFIRVAEKALEAARTDELLGEARYRVEMALPGEVARLKARTAETHGNLVSARTSVRRLQAALERLLARAVGQEEVPDVVSVPPPGTEEEAPENTGVLVERALDRRPEMAAVRALIQSARDRVRSEQGGLLPKLGASANYQWDSEDLGESAESWMVGLQATWPLFEGGMTASKIREARARLREMEARGEQIALDIALEVHHAALAVGEAAEKIQVAKERKTWAEQALEEVRQLYRNEMVTVDSLLQAEVSWNQAEVSHAEALFEGRIAQTLLRRSLGDFVDQVGGTP